MSRFSWRGGPERLGYSAVALPHLTHLLLRIPRGHIGAGSRKFWKERLPLVRWGSPHLSVERETLDATDTAGASMRIVWENGEQVDLSIMNMRAEEIVKALQHLDAAPFGDTIGRTMLEKYRLNPDESQSNSQ